MSRKTTRVVCIVIAFILNLMVYIGIINLLAIFINAYTEPSIWLNLSSGFIAYCIFLKIKPFRVAMMLKRYSEEIVEEHTKH